MRQILHVLCFFCLNALFAQTPPPVNCSNPKVVNLCTGQTTFWDSTKYSGNDVSWFVPNYNNLFLSQLLAVGEEVVYELRITPSDTATNDAFIRVDFTSLTAPVWVFWTADVCQPLTPASPPVLFKPAYCDNGYLNIPIDTAIKKYYLWVEPAPLPNGTGVDTVPAYYLASFGFAQYDTTICDTVPAISARPDSLGDFKPDIHHTCPPVTGFPSGASPLLPALHASWGATNLQMQPVFFPLNVPTTFCNKIHFSNTTGLEGLKFVELDFDVDLVSIVAPSVIPGAYNTGNWTLVANSQNPSPANAFYFVDTVLTGHTRLVYQFGTDPWGRGDWNGTGTAADTCFGFEFCVTATSLSNDPSRTNVDINMYSDSYGEPVAGRLQRITCGALYVGCSVVTNECPQHYILGTSPGGRSRKRFRRRYTDPYLPLTLLTFSGTPESQTVRLNWETIRQPDERYMLVERSQDAVHFEPLQTVELKGAVAQTQSYTLVDTKPFAPTSYYRLAMIKTDNSKEYSRVVAINSNVSDKLSVFPNPTQNLLNIRATEPIVSVKIVNSIGAVVFYQSYPNEVSSDLVLDMQNFSAGMYKVSVNTKNSAQTVSVIKKP